MVPIEFGNECIDDNSISYSVGSVWYDEKQCEKLQCIEERGGLYILAYGCSTIAPHKGCSIVPGSKENYPKCCPDMECPPGME
ncbi:toxin-like protein 14 [Stegodyphus dumicola]|uniref:toxin-like protein 14 n=1 Tax=Stegodyphus dumicola TaxID=202533 RepID=UPI0015ABF962|nr:toxin-like protein 14 [Stegodyphus dumicola]